MNPDVLDSIEDLARQYAPELVPDPDRDTFAVHVAAFTGALLLAYWVLHFVLGPGGDLLQPFSFVVAGSFTVAGVFIARKTLRSGHQENLAVFKRTLIDEPWVIYERVANQFTAELERQRARMLGPDSDWGRTRQPLLAATQEAARSMAYWKQRTSMDPSSESARQQLALAEHLARKFQDALTEVDARAHILQTFFNECEARVATMRHGRRDYDEVRKLGSLSERAEVIVADANSTLAEIGNSFIREAVRVGNALGGIERVSLITLAGDAPVDRIESLADRILENSEKERAVLERLAYDLS